MPLELLDMAFDVNPREKKTAFYQKESSAYYAGDCAFFTTIVLCYQPGRLLSDFDIVM
ncbi:hypothetical protein ABK730_04740 [Klebsiella indica]|uniref:hypothetical protein n=1 Tax=Klebsiella TaxID=570 RepID=UPI00148666A0|nr:MULTISPECIES: hypothetical protein [Klebsiella]